MHGHDGQVREVASSWAADKPKSTRIRTWHGIRLAWLDTSAMAITNGKGNTSRRESCRRGVKVAWVARAGNPVGNTGGEGEEDWAGRRRQTVYYPCPTIAAALTYIRVSCLTSLLGGSDVDT